MQHGVHPWLSNHGGRQLDGAPSSAETLLEIRENCPEVFEKCDVIADGGISRGSDIVKALALGAKGVAIGRGFLFALAFGEEGVGKAIRILKHEMEMTMGLLGVASVDQLRPTHVSSPYTRWMAIRLCYRLIVTGRILMAFICRLTREDWDLLARQHEHTCSKIVYVFATRDPIT